MKTFKFKATLKRPDGIGTWHYIDTPIDSNKEFGIKGKVSIWGRIHQCKFRGTLIPRGNQQHYVVLDKKIRETTGLAIGDEFEVEIWKDNLERTVEIPPDFTKSIETNPAARAFFGSLAYSYKKAYVDWINDAKRDSTRKNRIARAIVKLACNEKLR